MATNAFLLVYAPGEVEMRGDTVTPFAFAEAVYGIGEWRGLHRTTDFASADVAFHTTDTGYYCSATPVVDDLPLMNMTICE